MTDLEKEWYKLSVFVYNKEAISEVLQYLVQIINECDFLKNQVMISKKWQMGPHVQIIYSLEKNSLNLMDDVLQRIEEYLKIHRFMQTESYEKHMELSQKVAQLEEYRGEISPLKQHLEIINNKMDWNEIHTIFLLDVYMEIERSLSSFVCETYNYFYGLSAKEQDIFLSKCMIILGNQQEENDFAEGGIQYGYMTFQSHYYGFVSQLNLNKPSEQKIFDELQQQDVEITKNLVAKMEETVSQNIAAISQSDESLKYLALWQNTVIKMLEIYEKMLSENEISWNENHDMNTFMVRNKNKLSQFHSDLKQSEHYMDFLNSHFFIKHRLTINAFYTMLPLFGVSPLRKHKLCKYVADSVETFYQQDYSSVMKKINQTFRKVSGI